LFERVFFWTRKMGGKAYHPLEVDEAEPLAYIIAYNDEVWPEEPPVLRA